MGTAVEERPKRAEGTEEAKEAATAVVGQRAETGEAAAGVPALSPYSGRPVFVDASGRRRRLFRKAGWLVAGSCACYAVALGGSIVGGTSAAPWLPIPGMVQKAEGAVKQDTLADRAPKESAPKPQADAGTPTPGSAGGPLAGAGVPSTAGWTAQETTAKDATGKKDSASADKSSGKAPAKSAAGGDKAPAGTTGDQNPAPDKGSSGSGPGSGSGSTTAPDESAGGSDDSPVTNEPAPPAEQPGADASAPAPAGNPIGDLLGGVLGLPGKLLGG